MLRPFIMNAKPLSVTQITHIIKNTLESNSSLIDVWVVGEISNLNYHSSGHIYFSLKDENSLIAAAFFRYQNLKLSFRLENGMKIFALGSINVYDKRGTYQLIISQVKPEGIGELQKKIEQLKKKLLLEGLFDPKRKRTLPILPRRLGVVTSPTGAAIRDIIKVARRRFPNIDILICPAKVQGGDAAESIARAIEIINRPEYGVDVIIAGRGGGSFEDLMPFNEEIVVRAFFNSRVPIISAVGHQIDHPLCDDAADAYAPTPSAAAEMCIPEKSVLAEYIDFSMSRMNSAIDAKLFEFSSRLSNISRKKTFTHPLDMIYSRTMLITDLEKKISFLMKSYVYICRSKLSLLPSLYGAMKSLLKDKRHSFSLLLHTLDSLSPLALLNRGYSIITNSRKHIVRCIGDTFPGDSVTIEVSDGIMESTITQVQGVKRGI
jgi:exodeoxyribonuclease VII large subunit